VFVQHEDADDPNMKAGAPGWQLAAGLARLDGDTVVHKTYRDSFADTDLAAVLTTSGTQRLVVTGLASELCVQSTASSALLHGYDVTLASDAHTTVPAELPGGRLDAEAIVAFVNRSFATMRHPGRTVEVLRAADVSI
jgi:nicotinamidase-related amidase